jgi:hypothetical protein
VNVASRMTPHAMLLGTMAEAAESSTQRLCQRKTDLTDSAQDRISRSAGIVPRMKGTQAPCFSIWLNGIDTTLIVHASVIGSHVSDARLSAT